MKLLSGSPIARFAPPTSTSPELQTEIEKNATAVSSDRNDPMTRPCTPRCAEDDTALLVPLRGPNKAIGARIVAPATSPSSVASSASRKDSPKMIGKLPSTTVAMVFAPPNTKRKRSSGRAVRSAWGIGSTPCVSTSVIFGGAERDSEDIVGSVLIRRRRAWARGARAPRGVGRRRGRRRWTRARAGWSPRRRPR